MAAIETLGGRLIVMASRALARVAHEPGRLRAGLRPHPAPGAAAGDPALARRHVRPGAGRLLGHADVDARDGHRARHHRRAIRQGRRHQDLAARQGQGDRDAPAPAAGRAHVHRRRLQLRRADRRRRLRQRADARPERRAARHLRRDRAGRERRARRARAGRRRRASTRSSAPTVPLSRHIFAAPTRFYKTGVVFMAWLNGHQTHFTMVGGQQSARSLLHLAELFRLADAAGLLEQPELAVAPHADAARAARRRRLRRATHARLLDRPPLAVDQHRHGARAQVELLDRIIDGVRAARHPRDLAVARPGRRGRARPASRALHARHRPRAVGLLPRRHVPGARRPQGRRPRSTTTAAPSTRRRRWTRRAWCWSSAGCPARSTARPRHKDIGRRAREVRDGIGATAGLRAQRRHAARDRAAASDVRRRPRLHQHDGAGARPVRRARPRTTGALGVAVDVYHVWWDPKLAAQIERAGQRRGCSPSTSATGWCRRPTC